MLLNGVTVGDGATVRRAILDKNVVVEDGAAVGVDRDADVARGLQVSEGGITTVGKGVRIRR